MNQDEIDEGLANARREYSKFYATASDADALKLDGLFMAHSGLTLGVNTPRGDLTPKQVRRHEVATREAESLYMSCVAAVKASDAFRRLAKLDKLRIETDLMTVPFS